MGYYGLEAVKYLDSLDEKKLGEFINKYSEPRSLISPDTFTYFHK
jgi:predicted PolB exonuclease-like 3'-5' exonuclease